MSFIEDIFKRFWSINLIRFGIIAALNTLFGYTLYALLLTIGLHYVLATFTGQIIGILVNFKTYSRFVFRNGDNSLIGKFVGVYAFTYICNIIGIAYLVNQIGLSDYISGAVMVIPIGCLTFLLNKILVFKKINNNISEGKVITIKEMLKSFVSNKPLFAFSIVLLFGLAYMIKGSFDAGMSGDEHIHQVQAEHVYNYYASFGKDSTAATVTPDYNLPYYGQAVDNLAYAIAKWFQIEDKMQVRHTTNAVFAWFGMLFAALLAFLLAGRKYIPAIITFTLFFFSPRYMGHAYNDLKDSNLAALMMVGIYYIFKFLKELPKPKTSTIVMLIISIGLSVSVRIGGLLLIAYFGLFALVYYFANYSIKDIFGGGGVGNGGSSLTKGETGVRGGGIGRSATSGGAQISSTALFWKKIVGLGLLISICGYLLAVLLWPYALKAPIDHTIDSFKSMSQFAINIRQLFEGKMQWSNNLPWYYTPKFILMTIPVAVIIGLVIGLCTLWKKGSRAFTFMLIFAFVFPIFWITYTKANVYGGWRHSMFAYPPMVVFAGLGLNSLLQKFRSRISVNIFYAVTAAVVLALLWHPIRHYIKNHPYEYVYFNEASGGIKNALGRYEMDYYYHSTREAAEWVVKNAQIEEDRKIKLACFHPSSVDYYTRKDTAKINTEFSRIYDMGDRDWDYAIFTITGMNPSWLKNKNCFPPKNTVHTIDVDGTPICIILKRFDKNDFYAKQAKQRGDNSTAIDLYRKALDYNPYNEQALENLSELYLNTSKLDSAQILAEFWVNNVPDNRTAIQSLSNVYYSKRDFNSMLKLAENCKKLYPSDIEGYWMSALAYTQMAQGNRQYLQFALNDLQKLVEIRPFKQAYILMAQIYASVGDRTTAERCQNIAQRL